MTITCKVLNSFNSKNSLNSYNLILDGTDIYFDIKSACLERDSIWNILSQKIMFEDGSENGFVIAAVHNSNSSHEMHMHSETQD